MVVEIPRTMLDRARVSFKGVGGGGGGGVASKLVAARKHHKKFLPLPVVAVATIISVD